MTFTTLTFALFLVLVFGGYWSSSGRRAQNAILVVSSYVFYGWWDVRFCALILVSTLVDYVVGVGLMRTEGPVARRAWLGVSLVVNLGMLGFFKYFNFFAQGFQAMAGSVGWQVDAVTLNVILPVGISFYTFQTLGYTIDVYRRHTGGTRNLLDYTAYVSFFPQLVAGPIERAERLLHQIEVPRRFDRTLATEGCRQMLWGFFKKMVIADNLAEWVDRAYVAPADVGGPQLALVTVFFAFQVYCDFSAYSDIAIGTGKLFGIRLMRNFAYPYFSQSIGEFWRRWHISLSTWFRDYVLISLSRGPVTRLRRSANIVITFLVCGLWHGAASTFVLWGGAHGLGVLPETLRRTRRRNLGPHDTPGGEGLLPAPGALLRMLLTFTLLCLSFVLFRAESLADAGLIFHKITIGLFAIPGWTELRELVGDKDVRNLLIIVPLFVSIEWAQRRHEHALVHLPSRRWLRWLLYTTMVWIILLYGTRSNSAFIYFQF